MKQSLKALIAGIVTVFTLFFPLRSQAVPLDIPYITLVSTIATGSVILSSATFPNANTTINANYANYQWCITHVVVSGNTTQDTFTMAWSTAPFTYPLTTGTTDYKIVISTMIPIYDEQWPPRQPYCAPIGQPVLTLTASVATAILEVEGYLFKGWNP